MTSVNQFDNVRIVTTPMTERLGYAGKLGVCYGFTTPSVTGVEVVGDRDANYAWSVHFANSTADVWFSADLVEVVDHAPGTSASVGAYSETTPFVKRVLRRFRRPRR